MTGWLVFIYACLILVGGVIGHFKAGSTASLVMGIVFGVLLLLCSLLIFFRKRWSLYCALFLTLFLELFFTYRFVEKLKFFPSGFLSIVSLFMLVVLILKIRKKR